MEFGVFATVFTTVSGRATMLFLYCLTLTASSGMIYVEAGQFSVNSHTVYF
jgi:hypothetical protein